MVTSPETCDDGNAVGGDGCSAACATQAGYTCSGAPSLCKPICGDGLILGAETCDDGNAAGGDGCSAACQLECAAESEPNGVAASADGPFTLPLTACGAITPGSDKDVFAIVVPAVTDLRVETTDSGITTCAGIDTIVELIAPDGTTVLALDDQSGIGSCSLLDPASPFAKGVRHLSPGTYYVRVSTYGNTVAPAYRLVVSADALCGDGVVEGWEECEPGGAAPCTASCDRVPVCGDGFIDAPEKCDDGNATGGDGCSSVCQYEGVTNEVEANNTFMQADAALPPISATTLIVGSIGAIGDKDVFRLNVNSPSVVRFETLDGPLSKTCDHLGSTLRLYNGVGTQIYSDVSGGIGACSVLVVNLAPGIYYVEMADADNNSLVPEYLLEVVFHTSLGDEVEPNDTYQAATLLSGSDVYINGDHAVSAEEDWYRLEIPVDGLSIRAEIIEGSTETCESGEVESRLTLYDASVGFKADVDDYGRGDCSRMDGTGWPTQAPGAGELLAGTYYLQVRSPAGGSPGVFDYRLVLTIR